MRIVFAKAEMYHLMHDVKEKCSPGCMLAVISSPDLYYRSALLNEHCSLAAADDGLSFVLSMQSGCQKRIEKFLAARTADSKRRDVGNTSLRDDQIFSKFRVLFRHIST